MSIETVYLMRGYRGTMATPADLESANAALRAAVGKRGKRWKRVAPLFGLVRAGTTNELVLGVMLQKAPRVYDAPSRTYAEGVPARMHAIVGAHLKTESVDDCSDAIDGLLPAYAAVEEKLAPLGIRLDGVGPGATTGPHGAFLISPSGAGAVVALAAPSELTGPFVSPVERWSFDDPDAQRAEVVGVPIARVDTQHPIAALGSETELDAARVAQLLRDAGVRSPSLGLFLMTTAALAPTASIAPRPAIASTAFSLRSFTDIRAAFAASRPSEALREQSIDGGVALAFDDLAQWPDGSVNEAMQLCAQAPLEGPWMNATMFLRHFPMPSAIGTWNASATGRMASSDDWCVLDVELTSEQDDAGSPLAVTLALFRAHEGWVALVCNGSTPETTLVQSLGFDPFASSTAAWAAVGAFYGEGSAKERRA